MIVSLAGPSREWAIAIAPYMYKLVLHELLVYAHTLPLVHPSRERARTKLLEYAHSSISQCVDYIHLSTMFRNIYYLNIVRTRMYIA